MYPGQVGPGGSYLSTLPEDTKEDSREREGGRERGREGGGRKEGKEWKDEGREEGKGREGEREAGEKEWRERVRGLAVEERREGEWCRGGWNERNIYMHTPQIIHALCISGCR